MSKQAPMTNTFVLELLFHLLVCLSRPRYKYLNRKIVWVNWDVKELSARAEKIQSGAIMTFGYTGWPFSPVAA